MDQYGDNCDAMTVDMEKDITITSDSWKVRMQLNWPAEEVSGWTNFDAQMKESMTKIEGQSVFFKCSSCNSIEEEETLNLPEVEEPDKPVDPADPDADGDKDDSGSQALGGTAIAIALLATAII